MERRMIHHGGTEDTEISPEVLLFSSVTSVPPWLSEESPLDTKIVGRE
jgi:hypothetical protein